MPEPAFDANAGGGDACVGVETNGVRSARPSPLPEIGVRPAGDRVVVAVRGELDLDSAEQLEHALRAAIGAAVGGVDLELDGVGFCDCSALNVLLGLRDDALKQGKSIALRTVGPAVERLLTLTGTGMLFDAPCPDADRDGDRGRDRDGGEANRRAASAETREDAAAPHRAAPDAEAPHGSAPDAEDPHGSARDGGASDLSALEDLRIEVVQLRRAMQTRPVIDLARGILMASFGLSVTEAWRVLVLASQHTNTKLHHLARDLVAAVLGEPPSDVVQEQVAAAVAKVRSQAAPTGPGERTDRVAD